jgi:hypothetical protein
MSIEDTLKLYIIKDATGKILGQVSAPNEAEASRMIQDSFGQVANTAFNIGILGSLLGSDEE